LVLEFQVFLDSQVLLMVLETLKVRDCRLGQELQLNQHFRVSRGCHWLQMVQRVQSVPLVRRVQEIRTVLHFRMHLIVLYLLPGQVFQLGLMGLQGLERQQIQSDRVIQRPRKDPADLETHFGRRDRSGPGRRLARQVLMVLTNL